MPLLIAGAIGAGLGFWAGSGTENVSSAIKWLAIGGAVYVGARALKVI